MKRFLFICAGSAVLSGAITAWGLTDRIFHYTPLSYLKQFLMLTAVSIIGCYVVGGTFAFPPKGKEFLLLLYPLAWFALFFASILVAAWLH